MAFVRASIKSEMFEKVARTGDELQKGLLSYKCCTVTLVRICKENIMIQAKFDADRVLLQSVSKSKTWDRK